MSLCVYAYKNLMQIISTLMNLSKAFHESTFINHFNFSITYIKQLNPSEIFIFPLSDEVIFIRSILFWINFTTKRWFINVFVVCDYNNDSFSSVIMNFLNFLVIISTRFNFPLSNSADTNSGKMIWFFLSILNKMYSFSSCHFNFADVFSTKHNFCGFAQDIILQWVFSLK